MTTPASDPNSKATQPTAPTPDSFDELNELADKGELTEEYLQEQLQNYRTAIQQEFEERVQTTPENVEVHLQDFFRKSAPQAAAQIAWLAQNAESESVRLSANKVIIQAAVIEADKDGDPIKDLLKDLKKKPQPTPEELAS